jgi:hypothetical protein
MATSSKAGDKPVKPAAKPKAAKPAAKAPADKKPAAKKTPAPRKAAAKAASAKSAAGGQPSSIPVLTPDQRRYYVEVAAYYIAERRGFHGGSEMDDWVRAESEIDRLVREGILKP